MRPGEACTRFAGPQLTLRCAGSETRWQMAGQAKMLALVFVIDPLLIGHERNHMFDMQRDLDAHLRGLEEGVFQSEEACAAAAAVAAASFAAAVRRFAARSMARRH